MPGPLDLTGQKIRLTYPRVVQYDSGNLYDGLGNLLSLGVTDGDKGDITVSTSGTVWTIDNNAVTYAKMQVVTTNKLLGSGSGTSVAEITLGTGLSFSSTTLNATVYVSSVAGTTDRISVSNGTTNAVVDIASTYAGQTSITTLGTIATGTWQGTAIADTYISSAATWNAIVGITDGDKGDITVSSSGTAWAIDNNAVTYGKMQVVTTNKLLGSGSGTAVAEITLGTGLSFSGTTLNADIPTANVFNETPTGTLNGVNLIFTTASNFTTNSTRLYLNGQRLKLSGDYTETGTNQITFVTAPTATDVLIIDYKL